MLKADTHPNLRDRCGASPLHIAASTGPPEIIADLLEAGADLEALTVRGHSPLRMAVLKNRVHVSSLLLNARASTEHRGAIHGQTPLSWAFRGCLALIVRVLVEAGAGVESRSSAELTPLRWACRFIDAGNFDVLLNAGADPDFYGSSGSKWCGSGVVVQGWQDCLNVCRSRDDRSRVPA